MASSPADSSSFVVKVLLDELTRLLPSDEHPRLEPYVERAAHLDADPDAEDRRADACVEWTRDTTESEQASALGRMAARVVEDAREVQDAVDAALLRLSAPAEAFVMGAGTTEVSPGFRLRLNRALAAVKTAEKLAAKQGWPAVPWTELLDRVVV
jgi:hypothetical protein